jgi:alanine dehydrogenase
MIVGTPKEIKNHEYRVGLTPESVFELTAHGHEVLVETGAGAGIGADDATYLAAGARITETAAEVFATAEMIVKVKEPQPAERAMLRPGQILYTYLHLAPDAEQTKDLVTSGATCIAYETVTDAHGGLPLLKPMSQVAGRMSIQAGATALEKAHGGRGVLLGGVPGVAPAKVVVIGGGVVGFNAAQMAAGLGADVTILDRSPEVLEKLSMFFESRAKTRFSNKANLAECVAEADLVIGAVLIHGAAAPKLVTRAMLGTMKPGAVLVDVAIDQGGCFETSKATTHADPTYMVDGIVHYCVANMPGGVARTSTYALNNVTLPHALRIRLERQGHLQGGRRRPRLRLRRRRRRPGGLRVPPSRVPVTGSPVYGQLTGFGQPNPVIFWVPSILASHRFDKN